MVEASRDGRGSRGSSAEVSSGGKAGSIRAANRQRITEAILTAAREQLSQEGAAALSLRAVARDLEMSSSAVYRYFPSRDDLLTALIIEAYDSLGAAAEAAERRVARDDLPGRFRTICGSVRAWALANDHEYFLIYGSPVPGYQAPTDTVGPATRVARLLMTLMVELAARKGETKVEARLRGAGEDRMPEPTAAALSPIRAQLPDTVTDAQLVAGLGTFSALFGAVSFELSGQLHNVIKETVASRTAFFDALVARWLEQIGL